MSSSDEDASPAMQFTRSVRRIGRRPLASPSDSENTPSAVKAVVPSGAQQQSAVYGYVRQQLDFRSPASPAEKGASPQQHADIQLPLRVQQAVAAQPGALQSPALPVHNGVQPVSPAVQQGVATGDSPATPAAAKLVNLDLNDPYTPWLRTSTKLPLLTPAAAGQAVGGDADGLSCLSCSPVSSATSTSSSRRSPVAGTPGALASLCAAVADLQVKQHNAAATAAAGYLLSGDGWDSEAPAAAAAGDGSTAEQTTPTGAVGGRLGATAGHKISSSNSSSSEDESLPMTLGRRTAPRVLRRPLLALDSDSSDAGDGSEQEDGGDLQLKQHHAAAAAAAAGDADESEAPAAAAVAVDGSTAEQTTPTGAAADRLGATAGHKSSSSSSEDESPPMTLGRRTAPRVFRRPMQAFESDSSDGGDGSEQEDGSLSRAHGCCDTVAARRRVTPGSTSSLIARKPHSSGKGRRRPEPTDTGYTGAYDFDLHLSTIKPPRWQQQQYRRQVEQGSMTMGAVGRSRFASPRSPCSTSPRSPVAVLSFRPAPRGLQATAAAGSPAAGPRRLSQTFLGAGIPLSPPVLKQQHQQPCSSSTPAAAAAAAGRRAVQAAQTEVKPAANAPKGAAGAGQGFGQVLWPYTEVDAQGPAGGSKPGPGAGDFTPFRRRGKGVGGPGAPPAGKGAKAAATAPAKVPSSRTFARHRQQLAQELYKQWNGLVFEGSLPADLAVVWNPRLTATAGQVVDDGSRNHEKSSGAQRIPVQLELSSKVIDNETRLRSTLSHEMCHVAAWVISKEWKEHHGSVFWEWAHRFEALVPDIKITTCHNFDVHAPFRWQCSNYSCGKLYVRHKRSIDIIKHVCSRCNSRLLYLGKFSRDGKLIAGSVAGEAAGSKGSATPGGGNAFTLFVKDHFAEVKRGLPTGTPHKEVMTRLAAQYKEQKAAAAPSGVAAAPRAGRTGPAVVAAAAVAAAAGVGDFRAVTPAAPPLVNRADAAGTAAVDAAGAHAVGGDSADAYAGAGDTADVYAAAAGPEDAYAMGGAATGAYATATGTSDAYTVGGDTAGAYTAGGGTADAYAVDEASTAGAESAGGDESGRPASPSRSSDDGWLTAEEEVDDQTLSLLNFMDRLALS